MNQNVLTLTPDDNAANAYQVMLDKGFRGIPIVESEKVVGMVTMSDLLRVPREQMGYPQALAYYDPEPADGAPRRVATGRS